MSIQQVAVCDGCKKQEAALSKTYSPPPYTGINQMATSTTFEHPVDWVMVGGGRRPWGGRWFCSWDCAKEHGGEE